MLWFCGLATWPIQIGELARCWGLWQLCHQNLQDMSAAPSPMLFERAAVRLAGILYLRSDVFIQRMISSSDCSEFRVYKAQHGSNANHAPNVSVERFSLQKLSTTPFSGHSVAPAFDDTWQRYRGPGCRGWAAVGWYSWYQSGSFTMNPWPDFRHL